MSDIEDYNSDYNSETESSEDEKPINKSNKNIASKPLNIDDILGKDDSDSDIEDDEDEDEEQSIDNALDEDEVQYGGAEEEIDDEDDIEDEDENIDEKKNTNKKQKASKSIPLNIDEDDNYNDEDDDEDNEYDENYLQKFDRDINKNYVQEFHPECIIQNYDEIALLTRVVRNNQNIIIDPLHKTIPFLTKYEKARIIGQRAKQIETGAKPFIKVPENIIDSYIIAELELQQKRIPFIIRRPLPGGGSEYWNLKDLEIINF